MTLMWLDMQNGGDMLEPHQDRVNIPDRAATYVTGTVAKAVKALGHDISI